MGPRLDPQQSFETLERAVGCLSMSLKEANRLRLERLTARLAQRRASSGAEDAIPAFDAAFETSRDQVLVPLLRDIGAELGRAGHAHAIEIDGDARKPSVVFRVLLSGGGDGNANVIGFFARHDPTNGKSEVIAYLTLKVEFELGRFNAISEMTREALEQMLMDGIEHLIACNQ
jgi:hypothetical protein